MTGSTVARVGHSSRDTKVTKNAAEFLVFLKFSEVKHFLLTNFLPESLILIFRKLWNEFVMHAILENGYYTLVQY